MILKTKVKNEDNIHIVNKKRQSVMQSVLGSATVEAVVETP